MIDLTPSLERALSRREGWHWTSFAPALGAIALAQRLVVDWDSGAGEDWARLIDGKDITALVWTEIPFAFVDPAAVALCDVLKNAGLEIVEINDFDAPVLRLDLDKLPGLIDKARWPGDAVDATRMSASDLWWATV